MKPTYVTFEQAKGFKEKGLVAKCKRYWVKYSNSKYKEMSDIQLEDLDREIGIGGNLIIPKYEQWQTIEWLRREKGIWIHSAPENNEEDVVKWAFTIQQIDTEVRFVRRVGEFNLPQEAYSAAFDCILQNNLI